MENNEMNKGSRFYLGTFGAILPFLVFLACVVFLCTQGAAVSKTCGAAAFVGFVAAFFTMKDKKRFNELTLKGFTSSMLGAMLIAFLLAGVIAKMMAASGLTNSLVWAALEVGASAHLFPLIMFLTGAVISSATGTSAGTMTTITPVLLPMAITMGCHPALSVGAIISGSMFGDNLAPVSDTTIASAVSQESTVQDVVRTRFKYCIIGGLIASVLYVYFGFKTTQTVDASAVAMDAKPIALLMLIIPVLIVVLMLKKKGLVFSMLTGVVTGAVISIVFKLIPISQFIISDGIIPGGFDGMMGIFPFFYFIFTMTEIMTEGGVIDAFLEKVEKFATTPKRSEIAAGLMASIGSILITSPTVTIVIFGPMVRKLLKRFNIKRTRGANIMDGISCAFGGALPYSATYLVGVTQAQMTEALPDSVGVMNIWPWSFHCLALFAIFWVSILTGLGSGKEDPNEVQAGHGVLDTL